MTQNTIINSIFKSRKYLLEILEEQGFNINDYKNSSILEVHSMIQNKQLDLLIERSNPTKKVYIKYHLVKTLRPNNINEYIDDIFNLENILTKNDDLIIITKDEPNDTLTKFVTDIWEQDQIFVRIINIQRLQFNILKHELVPKHTILSEKELEEFKKQFNIKDKFINKQLPDISRFSPVSLAIGIRPGEICKIERSSRTAINSLFYRICI
jgi:DNA-directed RNA polymerase subunit H (RpoH/RPB5)